MGVLGRLAGALLVCAVSLSARSAEAQSCDPPTCAAMSQNHICNSTQYSCQYLDLGQFGGSVYGCFPNGFMVVEPPGGTACETDNNACTTDACGAGSSGSTYGDGVCHHTAAPDGTSCGGSATCTSGVCTCASGYRSCNGTCILDATCCTAGDCPSGGHVCSGTGGSCVCPGGSYDCQGTCIPNGTCCTSPPTCGAGVSNGSSVCPSNGGQCLVQCNGGYEQCGGNCVANAACCTDADCTALTNAAAHARGVCPSPGGSCVSTCSAGYKACAGSCIPAASCCSASDCKSPPNGCYATQGTCSAGSCAYGYNDGASCNADSDACTPNDACKSGSCVADTSHQVVCTQRDCHGAPSCNKHTGNCVDVALPNGTTCGANGCAETQGTCTAGACTSSSKDCTALDTACQVGTCDASKPVGTPCAAANKPNGTACNVDDKCVLSPACSGGMCTGDIKPCTPSGPCRAAACDPGSGNCAETVAPVGTACALPGSCLQNTTCDANGTCVGDPLPDETPCENASCTIAAVCGSGQCVCAESVGTNPSGPTSLLDGGTATKPTSKGCSTTPGLPGSAGTFLVACALLFLMRTVARHRRACLHRR